MLGPSDCLEVCWPRDRDCARIEAMRLSWSLLSALALVTGACSFDSSTSGARTKDATVPGTPDAIFGTPDAVPKPDSPPGTPDATPLPDAVPGTPDATPVPDATIVPDATPAPDAAQVCSTSVGTAGSADRVLDCNGSACVGVACLSGEYCQYDCTGSNSCLNLQVDCQAGARCLIVCSGNNSCQGMQLNASASDEARVQCIGNSSTCSTMDITCPDSGPCELDCANGACSTATMTCGQFGPCDVTCDNCEGLTQTCGDDRCTSCVGGASILTDMTCPNPLVCLCGSSC